jgi:hypothetical protein
MSNFYTVKPLDPFNYSNEVPALHHLYQDTGKKGIFKPDKLQFFLSSKWMNFVKSINSKAAFQYLHQLTSGVFATGTLKFQPCIFATDDADNAHNIVNILQKGFYFQGHEYGIVRTMQLSDSVPPTYQLEFLRDYGLVHRYVAQDIKGLNPAPKADGEVYVPLLSNGTILYMDMTLLNPA